ncbi:MAG: lipid-A-disaccharide synthase [Armatimonadota bacterium]|nr:lipid-A-disaccharide synthase [Armatimonadota bacterium]
MLCNQSPSSKFVLLAGEASGDAQGALLVEAIRRLEPHAQFWGVGGGRMKNAGVTILYDSSTWGSIGVIESLKLVAPLTRIKRELVHRCKVSPPDLLIPIDFGYFNLRVAGEIRASGSRVLYYFPPKSWSRDATVSQRLRESVDAVATPFPWSADRLREAGVPVSFVGHPLLDTTHLSASRTELCTELNFDSTHPVVALLPGSRTHEVKYLWPQLVAAAKEVAVQIPGVQFVVPAAPSVDRRYLMNVLHRQGSDLKVGILEGRTGDALIVADVVAACSGTATLEAAIRLKPMVILYGGSWLMSLEWAYRKPRLNLPFIGMPNVMAGREVAPELIGEDATGPKIAEEILSLLTNSPRADKMRSELREVVQLLGAPGAADRTAAIAIEMARGPMDMQKLNSLLERQSCPLIEEATALSGEAIH